LLLVLYINLLELPEQGYLKRQALLEKMKVGAKPLMNVAEHPVQLLTQY
jgi:hypothetical protein